MLAKTSTVCPVYNSVSQTMVAIRVPISNLRNRTLDLRVLSRLRFCSLHWNTVRLEPAGIRALGLLPNCVSAHWQAYMDRSDVLHMLAEIEALAALVEERKACAYTRHSLGMDPSALPQAVWQVFFILFPELWRGRNCIKHHSTPTSRQVLPCMIRYVPSFFEIPKINITWIGYTRATHGRHPRLGRS
jgi:hypothetical protein